MLDATSGLVLGDRDYRRIQVLVREQTGIELGPQKRQLCQTRLLRRLRALGMTSFESYLELLDNPASPEHHELVNAITTNVTAFFREPHHFELLAKQIVPRWRAGDRIRVWSAGCSSGEEPWSLALTLHEALGGRQDIDVKILATDIDTDVLARARAGVYSEQAVAPIAAGRRQRYLERGTGSNAGRWRIRDELRELVTFNQLNLFDPWPMRGAFDVIFCRNVIIYFDAPSKLELVRRYAQALVPGGHLFLGHSESLMRGVDELQTCAATVYRRTGSQAAG